MKNHLRLYERDPKTGQRIPWVYELEDDHKTIRNKYVDKHLWERMKRDTARALGVAQNTNGNIVKAEAPVAKKGFIVKKTPQGEERMAITEFDRKFAEWMLDTKINPFPGTEDLRTTYFTLRKQQEEGSCTNCEISQLIREYKERVAKFVEGK